MNTNLNNIPIEIYLDYISEQTNQEWTLEHILTTILYNAKYDKSFGNGCMDYIDRYENVCGSSKAFTQPLYTHGSQDYQGSGCNYFTYGNGFYYSYRKNVEKAAGSGCEY